MGTTATSTDGSGGTGTAPNGGPEGQDGNAAGTGTQPGAGGGNGGGDSGAPASGTAASSLDRNKLNPLLRGMDEDSINEVFDTMFNAIRRTEGGGGTTTEPVAPTRPKAPTSDELREFFDPNSEKFAPEAAIAKVVEANYGGLLTDIGSRAMSGVMVQLERQFPDITEYQAGIKQVLGNRDPATISQQDIIGAYFMAKGAAVTEREIKERKTPPKTAAPTPVKEDRTDEPSLSAAELEVAKVMFRGAADPAAEWRKSLRLVDNFHVKVPGDK